ncbi:MAG: hypothetical protein LBG47_08800 [Prevotellaceae bacterium]|nr:hypothetical protein [Prevotellaceae bacterium]
MQTYRINAWVSGNGTILLPNMPPDLYNREVQLVITLKQAEAKKPKNEKPHPVPNFVELCRSLRDCRPSKEEVENEDEYDRIRYEYLMEKYK